MNQRLIWNFEFTRKRELPFSTMVGQLDDKKWEIRYFWSENQVIPLYNIDEALLDITYYQQKQKNDCYYLLPRDDYNIKVRHNRLLYKPILDRSTKALGFGTKLDLEQVDNNSSQECIPILDLQKILYQVRNFGKKVYVNKTSFTFKFPTNPPIKLELARLKVHDTVYFSACIEGKSLHLVETINKHLLDEQISCEYVAFLKKINLS